MAKKYIEEGKSPMGIVECVISAYNEYHEKIENDNYIANCHRFLKETMVEHAVRKEKLATSALFRDYDKCYLETDSGKATFYFIKEDIMVRAIVSYEKEGSWSFPSLASYGKYESSYKSEMSIDYIQKIDPSGDFSPENITIDTFKLTNKHNTDNTEEEVD